MARLIRVTAEPAWGWCGGLRHPPQAEYPAGALKEAQLRDMRANPSLTVEEIDEEANAMEAARLAAEEASRAEAARLVGEDAARAEAERQAAEAAAAAAAPPGAAKTRRQRGGAA